MVNKQNIVIELDTMLEEFKIKYIGDRDDVSKLLLVYAEEGEFTCDKNYVITIQMCGPPVASLKIVDLNAY